MAKTITNSARSPRYTMFRTVYGSPLRLPRRLALESHLFPSPNGCCWLFSCKMHTGFRPAWLLCNVLRVYALGNLVVELDLGIGGQKPAQMRPYMECMDCFRVTVPTSVSDLAHFPPPSLSLSLVCHVTTTHMFIFFSHFWAFHTFLIIKSNLTISITF